MQNIIETLVFIVIFFSISLCLATEPKEEKTNINGYVSAGGGYDSFIPSLNKDSTKRKGSGEIIFDSSLNFDFSEIFFGISTYLNALNADNWSNSIFFTHLNGGWGSSFDNYDFSLFLSIGFSAYDFEDFRAYYTDANLDGEMFFNHSQNMSYYLNVFGSYTYGIDKMLSYLKGPSLGFETGEYFYFGENDNYFRINFRANFVFYGDLTEKDYPYLGENGISSLTAKNRGIELWGGFKSKFNWHSLFIVLTPSYRNSTMYSKDMWEYSDRFIKKRRVDHTLQIEVEPGWYIIDELSLNIFYGFEKNFSTIEKNDYSNQSYVRHNVRLIVSYDF